MKIRHRGFFNFERDPSEEKTISNMLHIIRRSVEGGTARGMTALVYLQLHISLYTGTVHVLSGVAGVYTSD